MYKLHIEHQALGTPTRQGLTGNLSDSIRKVAEWRRAQSGEAYTQK